MTGDPLRYFRIEARELVDQISAGVLDLDQEPGPDVVARLLRFAHTLKGAARVVRQQEIADRAHAFEEVLVPHRDEDAPLPADQMRELLRLNDEIEARVAALDPAPAPEPPKAEAGAPAVAAAGPPEPSPDSAPPPRAATADVDELLEAIGEAHARFGPLRTGAHALDRLHRAAETVAD